MATLETISTDAEGSEDMERRRLPQGDLNAGHLEPPPQPLAPIEGSERTRNDNGRHVAATSGNGNGNSPNERNRNDNGAHVGATLEQRIAACLQGGDISADKLAELISETRSAITQASIAAEAARARAYDPAIVDRRARRDMEHADHLARRLRLALPQLHTKLQKLHNAQDYREWLTDFELVRLKHASAANKLREVYTEFEQKLVAALAAAHQVDAEVDKVMDAKPRDNPLTDNDGKRLLAVECAARHLGSIDQAHSLMHMKIPAFSEPNKFSWPPVQTPLGVQIAAAMTAPRGPSADWQRDIAERDRARHAESQRVAQFYANQAREKEERDNAAARAARQRNGSAP